MNITAERMNKYLEVKSISYASNSSLPYKKRPSSYQVSDKELSDGIYRWDDSLSEVLILLKLGLRRLRRSALPKAMCKRAW